MILPGTPFIRYSPVHHRHRQLLLVTNTLKKPIAPPPTSRISHKAATRIFIASTAAAVLILSGTMSAIAIELKNPPPDAAETLSNIPQTLSGDCVQGQDGDCKKARIQKPKSRKAESCTIKCVTTCIRGGDGSPGEGPINVRRPLVVFKQGFRSRHYCLVECSDICNLIRDGDDGP
ncbi:hypothetical protein L1987_26937 [Smallanthus sonchifolius]|uniref:Uncharacterized protein n=1 Tax=Smallanthus sonchifolius TaxID=185202 RepID=A0ACB9IBF1_9ASTR|nr:hypothetical protein L1987_26937 [Smallanthus sonchifolius]